MIHNTVRELLSMQVDNPLVTPQVDLLYRGYHSWLRSWLVRRVGCHEHAADLAQDTFVRLLRSGHNEPLEKPRAFLSSIARGLMIDQHRRKVLEREYLDSLTRLSGDEVPSEEQRLLILDILERLDRALSQVKPRVREAFMLAQLSGLTIPQIAEQLEVSRATVERDLAKALSICYRVRYAEY